MYLPEPRNVLRRRMTLGQGYTAALVRNPDVFVRTADRPRGRTTLVTDLLVSEKTLGAAHRHNGWGLATASPTTVLYLRPRGDGNTLSLLALVTPVDEPADGRRALGHRGTLGSGTCAEAARCADAPWPLQRPSTIRRWPREVGVRADHLVVMPGLGLEVRGATIVMAGEGRRRRWGATRLRALQLKGLDHGSQGVGLAR